VKDGAAASHLGILGEERLGLPLQDVQADSFVIAPDLIEVNSYFSFRFDRYVPTSIPRSFAISANFKTIFPSS